MKRASAPGYDRFKSIVIVILMVILILMLLRGCAINAASPAPVENTIVPNATEVITEAVPASNTAEITSPSSAPPTATATLAPVDTLTSAPASPTPTIVAATSTPTSAAAETPTPTPGGFVTPGPAEIGSCNTSVPSRLSVGQTARVLARLNMRNDPSIEATLIQTNPTNTQVEIIGGPVCESVGDRAYLWWQIRLLDGAEGWSAETQLNTPSYFLEPVP